jgi:hypothetical protein
MAALVVMCSIFVVLSIVDYLVWTYFEVLLLVSTDCTCSLYWVLKKRPV